MSPFLRGQPVQGSAKAGKVYPLCALPVSHISPEWQQSHPVSQVISNPIFPVLAGPPSALLGGLVTQSWCSGLFLPSEQSGHCPPLGDPTTTPIEGKRGVKAWRKPPGMGSVLGLGKSCQRLGETPWDGLSLTVDVAPCLSCLEPRGSCQGRLRCPWTWTRDRFQTSHQNRRSNKVLNPSGCTCSHRRGECLTGEHVTNPPGEIPPFLQGQGEGISGWDGLFDLHV